MTSETVFQNIYQAFVDVSTLKIYLDSMNETRQFYEINLIKLSKIINSLHQFYGLIK